MDPQLSHLRAFLAVAEERHFGRAAQRLGLSQPAVSRRVRGLEEALGVPLLERTSRLTRLTDAGEALLRPARDLLDAADRLQTVANTRGRVTVAFVASTTAGYAAAVAPHAEILQLAVTNIAPALRRGDVDFAITRPLPGVDDLVQLQIAEEPTYVAVAASHPLAARGAIDCAELDGETFVAQDRRFWPEGHDANFERLRERGCVPAEIRYTSRIPACLALVAAGAGVHRIAAPARVPTPGVVYLELNDLRGRVVLVRRPEPPRPAVAELITQLRMHAPNHPLSRAETPFIANPFPPRS